MWAIPSADPLSRDVEADQVHQLRQRHRGRGQRMVAGVDPDCDRASGRDDQLGGAGAIELRKELEQLRTRQTSMVLRRGEPLAALLVR